MLRLDASLRELKKLFGEGGTGQGTTPPALSIEHAALGPVFPSLIKRYLEVPVGSVTVKNLSSRPVDNVKVSAFINRYMDFPAEMPVVARIAPGATATVPLCLAFAPGLTEVQEDLPVQVLIEVSGVVSGVVQTVSKTVNATVLRRTALVWDDTRKIAAFITPNDDTVSGFALRTSSVVDAGSSRRLSARLLRAIRIIDALGACGISYVEDPDSPITKALGSSTTVDTVRFPRTTLANRTGDCDDTTVLLATLLEGAHRARAHLPRVRLGRGRGERSAAHDEGSGNRVVGRHRVDPRRDHAPGGGVHGRVEGGLEPGQEASSDRRPRDVRLPGHERRVPLDAPGIQLDAGR